MNTELNEVFRGHLEECLEHFSKAIAVRVLRGTHEAVLAKQPLADFCGVKVDSVTRWFSNPGSLPIGDQYIKLVFFLDLSGYRVIELERMQKARRNFAEVLGLGFLSGKQLAERLGYANVSTLYDILHERHGASKEKEQIMWDIWKEHKDALEQRKEELGTQYGPKALSETTEEKSATVVLMKGLLVTLEEHPLDRISEGELAAFYESAETVLKLSAHLNVLSAKILTQKEEKGGAT